MAYQDGLKQDRVDLDPLAALRAPVDALLGVSDAARDALSTLGITTVLDLATSPLFALAYEIGESARGDGAGPLAHLGTVPGGAVTSDGPRTLAEVAAADLSVLRSLPAASASAMGDALHVDTVGDLGRWIPYRSARAILRAATGADEPGEEEASELVPKMGEFPTERRYYSTIVMDQVEVSNPTDLVGAGPIDISPTIAADFGFSAPAVGARLTFEQSWFAHGVTLGNLLHSVALAPGESTRIAVLDWSRRTSASGTETIGETEALTNRTAHNRAVSEVQEAVAHEVQRGFSHTESTANTVEGGGGFGLGLGPLTIGGSASGAETTTSADSFSSSRGSRDLAASMSQQVMDATQQAASSVRNRRASIVKEVSEEEHESVSTRILANYNHMHALTVQYYEVVEVYRVTVALHEAVRCLFVPMKLVNFDDAVIARYRGALAAAALDRRARELLTTDFGMIRLKPKLPVRPFLPHIVELAAISEVMAATTASESTSSTPAEEQPAPAPPSPAARLRATTAAADGTTSAFEWDVAEIRRASRITASPVVQPGADGVLLPRDALLEGVNVASDAAGALIEGITIRRQSGQPDVALVRTSIGWRIPGKIPLQELLEVVATTGTGTSAFVGRLTLELSYHGAYFPVTLPIRVAPDTSAAVVQAGGSEAGPELVEHLQANRLHYNQAIWRSFDASTVALLLSPFQFEGQPVADLIDPHPIQIAGNYLVFRMPGFVARASLPDRREDESSNSPEATSRRAWKNWLAERGLTFGRETTTEQLVPVPTGGVFAEAVLGRSNSAEKLDATRFWNWQDSPIPLQPPEIAAINMASRAQSMDVTPGQLGQPVLNIVNPTALPDPTGVGSIIGAIQNGGMFRDMAGLAATIGLAQGASGGATSAAADAGKLAAANLAVAAQKEIEQDKIAAQLALAAMGVPGGAGPKNITESGALLNTAQKLDQQKGVGGAATSAGNGTGAAGEGSSDGAGGVFDGAGGDGDAGGGTSSGEAGGSAISIPGATFAGSESLTDATMRRAVFGPVGAPIADLFPAGLPAGGGSSGATSPRFVDEIFFYEHVVREAGLATIAGEVQALENSSWKPSSVDFRAISIRSNHGRDPGSNAEVSNPNEFLAILRQPARRFDFFGTMTTMVHDGQEIEAMPLDGAVRPNTTIGSADPSTYFSRLTITALRELSGLSSGGGALGDAVRDLRRRNAEYGKQAGDKALRELWLYLVGKTASDAFLQDLAKGLGMRVVAFPEPIVFRPEYTVSPPSINRRGIVELFGVKTTDVHKFDGDGVAFDP